MKKLFENWRKYLVLNERSDYEIFRKAGRNPYTGAKMNYNTAPVTKEEAARNKKRVMRQIVSIGDPTGVSSWPDVEAAWNDVEKEPTYANSGAFVFQFASAIPVIGKLPQWLGKGAKLLGIVDDLSDVSKAHRATGTAAGMAQADKIDGALSTARKSIERGTKKSSCFGKRDGGRGRCYPEWRVRWLAIVRKLTRWGKKQASF